MFEDVLVRDWMNQPAYTITPQTSIPEAHKIMKTLKIRRLPVLKEGQLVGIVTLGDVREASPSDATSLSIWELNYLWAQLTVERIMTTDVVTVQPNEPLLNAAELMMKHRISGLPVVEDGKVIGMITESDVFRMLVRSRRPTETPS